MSDVKEYRAGLVPDILGILPLRGTVLLPHAVLPLGAGRASSIRLIEEAVQSGRLVGAVMQRDPQQDAPGLDGLHPVGTVTVIHKAVKQADGSLRLIVQGLGRFRLVEVIEREPYLRARVEAIEEPAPDADLELEALTRSVRSLFEKVVTLTPGLPDELISVVGNTEAPGAVADLIAATLPTLANDLKQQLLETVDVRARLQTLAGALAKEADVLELGSKIQSEVQSEVSKTQREYYLREQMKAIQKELGDSDDRTQEIESLRQKIEAAGMPEEAQKEALRELDRLAKMPPAAAEYTVARTYIDWLIAMPWSQETTDAVDLTRAREILDEDHEGVEKIKERILEYLAVKKIRAGRPGPDPVLRRPSRRRQDLARQVDCPRARPQVPPHLARRHARRGGDPRAPAHVHRRPAGTDRAGPAADGEQEPRPHAGRDRQARHGLPGRPRLGPARGARPRAEQHVP